MATKNNENIQIKELDPDIIPPKSNQYNDPNIKCGSKIVIVGKPGCFEKGTGILMFDGTIKNVENVEVGDKVMGDDSTERNVLELCRNRDIMYKITSSNSSYTVNRNHSLVLYDIFNSNTIEIPVCDFLLLSENDKKKYKIFKTAVYFPELSVEIDPYILGLWIAIKEHPKTTNSSVMLEGTNLLEKYCKNRSNKYMLNINFQELDKIFHEITKDVLIPHKYIANSSETRFNLLAGLLDFDTKYNETLEYLEFTCKTFFLVKQIQFLCSTLGFVSKIRNIVSRSFDSYDTLEYYSLEIYGNLSGIPLNNCVCPVKEWRNVLMFDFTVKELKEDDYYGFTLDNNHRFLLDTCDVVRNTGKSTLIKSLLYSKKHIFPCGIAISGTEDSNHAYRDFMPSSFIYNEYSEDVITEFIKRQKLAAQHLKNPWSVLILDDCTDDPKIFNSPIQHALYKKGRHWNMMYILSLQYAMDIKPVIRTNVDGIFILREPLQHNRETLYRNYASIIPSFSIFCDLMDQLTDDHCAMFILNATSTNVWQDCVYYWKAPKAPENWRMGNSTFWDHHNQRYDSEYVDPVNTV